MTSPHVCDRRHFECEIRSSCVVRSEELFTLEELARAGEKLKINRARGNDGVPNDILKEVIAGFPEILQEAFNSCLRERRLFADWKKQRLVLLRKSNKPLKESSFYRPIFRLDTIRKLLEELILQRLQSLLVGENGLLEKQFGFRKSKSTVDAIQAMVYIAANVQRGTCNLHRVDAAEEGSRLPVADDR